LNKRLVVSLAVVVAVIVTGTLLVAVEQGGGTTTTLYQTSTNIVTGQSFVNPVQKVQLRLSVNASYSGGADGNVTVQIKADEFNTLTIYSDLPKADGYPLSGLSLGSCGNTVYPFGVALYTGKYTGANISQATALYIYPPVACPQFIRLITGYLFSPTSNLAVVLPSQENVTVPMQADVTATGSYGQGGVIYGTPARLGPGTYTVAAGDEWGTLDTVYFTIGAPTIVTTAGSSGLSPGMIAPLFLGLVSLPVLCAWAAGPEARSFLRNGL